MWSDASKVKQFNICSEFSKIGELRLSSFTGQKVIDSKVSEILERSVVLEVQEHGLTSFIYQKHVL